MQNRLSISMVVLVGLLWIPFHSSGQSNGDIPKVTSAYALQNVNLVSSPGNLQENVTILIEDGLIQVIGSRISIPAYAKLIECDSMFVYAGFIEGISHTGIPTRKDDAKGKGQGAKVENPGNPPNNMAGITPEKSIRDIFSSADKSVSSKRALGFTMSHVVPKDGMMPGKGSLVLLGEGETDELILKENVSLYSQFSPARRMYPSTVIGVIAKWRDLYRQAMYFSKHKTAFDSAAIGVSRPHYDRATEALFPIVNQSMPVYFKTNNALDIYKALNLQDDLGFDLVLAEVKEGWRVADVILERNTPVLVALDLPEDKSDKKKEEKAKDDEAADIDEEKAALTKRRNESLVQHYSQAAVLTEAGIPLAFSMLDLKSKDFHGNVRKMIKNGLSADVALAALTTVPAKMFGVDGHLGTVAPGKIANLIVTNGRYFAEKTQVRYVFVEGKMFEYEIKKKKEKKSSDGEAADIAGTWSFEVEIPGDTQTGTIKIKKGGDDYKGQITSDDDGESTPIENIEVIGNSLTFTMVMSEDGQSMTLDFELTIDGEFYSGEVSVGEFGTFPMEGERIPE